MEMGAFVFELSVLKQLFFRRMAMKKILLILAMALLWSFNVNAQAAEEKLAVEAMPTKALDRAISADKIATLPTDSYKVEADRLPVELGPQKAVQRDLKSGAASESCVTYTAEKALDATANDNNNVFVAVYSTNATRNCGRVNSAPEAEARK